MASFALLSRRAVISCGPLIGPLLNVAVNRIRHNLARPVCRHFLSWRLARVCCAVWFTLTSIGFPISPTRATGTRCAVNPGQQCRCSMAKRMSGTCCCGRDAATQSEQACCVVTQSTPKISAPTPAACCQKKATTQSLMTTSHRVELSVGPCDCGSDSPAGVSLVQEPRLPATSAVSPLPESDVAFVSLPVERVESALLLPPVPPPKVVL